MDAVNESLRRELSRYLDEGDWEALERGCDAVRAHPLDVDALLSWVQGFGAAPALESLALRRLRFALGLPVVAGPVCRPRAGNSEP